MTIRNIISHINNNIHRLDEYIRVLQIETGDRLFYNKKLNKYYIKQKGSSCYTCIKKTSYDELLNQKNSSHDSEELDTDDIYYDSSSGKYQRVGTKSSRLKYVFEDYWTIYNKKSTIIHNIVNITDSYVIGYIITDSTSTKLASSRGIAIDTNNAIMYRNKSDAEKALRHRMNGVFTKVSKFKLSNGKLTLLNDY